MASSYRIYSLLSEQWKTRVLQSAIKLKVFTQLARRPLTGDELRTALGLRAERRATVDFFDVLVALGLLLRTDEHYRNSAEASEYLDENKPALFVGDAINEFLTLPSVDLTEALLDGPATTSAQEFHAMQYATADGVARFLRIMTVVSAGPAQSMAKKFPWHRYDSFVDVGCAEGALVARVLCTHPHLTAVGFDLPVTQQRFEDYTAAAGVADRVRFQPGDFFLDPLPEADVVVLGQVLHNWNLAQKHELITKAYDALPHGGTIVVYEVMLDEERHDLLPLLVSLSMNLVLGEGAAFTGAECRQWLHQAGFQKIYLEQLDGSRSMVVGIK